MTISKETNIKFNTKGVAVMGKVYGYCRISTKQQSIERQIRNIKATYPTAIIVEETTIRKK